MPSTATGRRITRRLLPLFIANFLQEMIFWYGIEKLFMVSIGFTNATIAVATAFSTVVILLAQVPTGLLADRWSRKGVIAVAGLLLIITTLIGGTSHSVPQYLLLYLLWGVFFSMRSGIFDSVIYDVLLEETGASKGFEKYYGYNQAVNGVALAVGSLLSGVIGAAWGLRAAYFLTIPGALLSIIVILRFKEPRLHHTADAAALSVFKHFSATWKAVLQRGVATWIVGAAALCAATEMLLFELSQLWYIALALPLVLYGPAFALVQLSISASGLISHFLQNRTKLIGLAAIGTVAVALGLITHVLVIVILAQFLVLATLLGLGVILSHLLHDRLPSFVRTGASSIVSTIGQLAYIPAALLFGNLATQHSVFSAAWVIIAGCLCIAIATISINRQVSRV